MLNLSTLVTNPLFWLNRKSESLSLTSSTSEATRSPQIEAFHRAFHNTYGAFAQNHPEWVQRGFNQEFLRQAIPPVNKMKAVSSLPGGMELAMKWDRQFGVLASDADRVRINAELSNVANRFIDTLADEITRTSGNW